MKKKVSDWSSGEAFYLIAKLEGCKLTAYRCPAVVWTIGYGTTRIDGKPVAPGQRITQAKADDLLTAALEEFKTALAGLITVPVTRGQFCALMSFIYNIGPAAFARSGLRRLVNAGEIDLAADEFRKWRFAGKVWDTDREFLWGC